MADIKAIAALAGAALIVGAGVIGIAHAQEKITAPATERVKLTRKADGSCVAEAIRIVKAIDTKVAEQLGDGQLVYELPASCAEMDAVPIPDWLGGDGLTVKAVSVVQYKSDGGVCGMENIYEVKATDPDVAAVIPAKYVAASLKDPDCSLLVSREPAKEKAVVWSAKVVAETKVTAEAIAVP